MHFVILGALLFGTYRFFNFDTRALSPKRIIIDQALIMTLTKPFEKSWLRQPTTQERDGLIQAYIKEDVLYREALELGLDQNDPIIRRRLRQ